MQLHILLGEGWRKRNILNSCCSVFATQRTFIQTCVQLSCPLLRWLDICVILQLKLYPYFFLVRTYWKICFILFKLSKPFAYNGWEVSWLEKRNAQFLGILRCLLCWYIEISYEDIQSHETDEVQVFVAQMVVSHQVWLFTSYFYAKSILSIQMDWRGNCI